MSRVYYASGPSRAGEYDREEKPVIARHRSPADCVGCGAPSNGFSACSYCKRSPVVDDQFRPTIAFGINRT